MLFRANETEKRKIVDIASDLRTITLDSPLEQRHLGESYETNGFKYDMRAEVGVLTRNIKIVGKNFLFIKFFCLLSGNIPIL